jgi:hypothetical protein
VQPPIIVNITRLHRKTAAVVQQASDSNRPIFVTQQAFVTAVLLPRRMYDRLLSAAGTSIARDEDDSSRPPISDRVQADDESAAARSSDLEDLQATLGCPTALQDPLAVFGPLPPGTRFEGPYGPIDAALAAFFMEDGIEVKPILRTPGDDWDDDWEDDRENERVDERDDKRTRKDVGEKGDRRAG